MSFETNESERSTDKISIHIASGSSWSMTGGGRLLLKGKNGGDGEMEDIFDKKVPNGKSWRVKLSLHIEETPV